LDIEEIDWNLVSQNQGAISLLEKNLDKVDWIHLSYNPAAIPILEKNLDEIDWSLLSRNPNAIHLLEQNLDKVDWFALSYNTNGLGLDLFEKNLDKKSLTKSKPIYRIRGKKIDIPWEDMSQNPAIFEYNYQKMKERCSIFKEELIAKVFHPKNYHKFVGLGCDEFDD
jgi:hypothetical protein